MPGQEGKVGRFRARNCGVGGPKNRALPSWRCQARRGASVGSGRVIASWGVPRRELSRGGDVRPGGQRW
eukprot:4476221-Pyramimonas_sp.AAC.1